jgi:hypothetical protein
MNPHEKLDKLKLEYHKLISAKLKKDPELLKPVICNLRSAIEKLKSAGDHPSAYNRVVADSGNAIPRSNSFYLML